MLRVLLAAAVVLAAFAGCLDGDDDRAAEAEPSGVPGYLYTGPGQLFAGPALYEDPQNTPHPAYNWPTLTHPAVGPDVPDWWRPANATALPGTVTGMEHLTATPGVDVAGGIALFGRLAVVPGYASGPPQVVGSNPPNPSHVVDISDPTHPVVLSTFGSQLGAHRGATIIAYPTGRLVTVISTGSGLDVWDITDPRAPQPLPTVGESSHKVGVVPGTPIVYNADSGGGGQIGLGTVAPSGVTQMWDFSDPEDVITLPDFENGYSCHHIFFWNNVTQDKFRAICAGYEVTQIIDTADPSHPQVVVDVPFGTGGLGAPLPSGRSGSFSHYGGLSVDGTLLLAGDEHGGGTGPIGCGPAADTPEGRLSTPVGAVWFYDVSDETDPQLKGWVTASQLEKQGAEGLQQSCTAHHGRLLPTPGRDILAMAFYGAGVLLVDFTPVRSETPGLPVVLDQFADDSDTWETWYYNGYLFTGDLLRGMDILQLT